MQITLTAIAHVTKTAQSRQVGENNAITARFDAEIKESWLDRNNEWQGRETPIVVQAWNGLATRIMNKAPQVDERVFIEGSIDVQQYSDRDGNFRAPIVVRASIVRSLGTIEDSDYMKVQGIGNLGDDPEMRYTNERGDAATNFRIAVNRSYTDSAGEKHDDTRWFAITAYGDLGENCNTYLMRGSMVQVTSSRIAVDTWRDKDDVDHARLAITARRVDFLARTRGSAEGDNASAQGASPAQSNAPAATDDDDDMPW